MPSDLLPLMELPILPLRTMVLFPHAALPMTLNRANASQAVAAAGEDGLVCGGRMQVFIEPVEGTPTLCLFGAGHVAQPLSRLAKSAGFRVEVVDDRLKFANRDRFPDADEIFSDEYETVFPNLEVNGSTYIIIVTRGHRDDMRVLHWAVQTPAPYVAMIGSKRKVISVIKELEKEGIPPSAFERIFAPMGFDIGAVTPEEIGISVVAEMIASGELSALAQPGAEPAARHSLHKTGAVLSDGIALGHVVLHEPRVVIKDYIAEDLPKEIKRLDAALAKLRADLDRMLERGDLGEGGEHREVLEAYRMFANDQGWSHKLHEAVATGLTAEAAVERVQSDTRARMLRSTDPYLRDRLHDLEDLGHRLMRQLVGQDHAPSREQLPDNAILIARAMGPAALLDYDRKRLRGLVLEEGTANSHVSIVARALGIPAVGEVPNAPGIADPGDAIIVDGTSGSIYIRPSAEIESAYAERVRFRARRQAQY